MVTTPVSWSTQRQQAQGEGLALPRGWRTHSEEQEGGWGKWFRPKRVSYCSGGAWWSFLMNASIFLVKLRGGRGFGAWGERCVKCPSKTGDWRRKWQPTPVFLPGKSHGQRSLAGYSPWGRKESETTEWLRTRLEKYNQVGRHLWGITGVRDHELMVKPST